MGGFSIATFDDRWPLSNYERQKFTRWANPVQHQSCREPDRIPRTHVERDQRSHGGANGSPRVKSSFEVSWRRVRRVWVWSSTFRRHELRAKSGIWPGPGSQLVFATLHARWSSIPESPPMVLNTRIPLRALISRRSQIRLQDLDSHLTMRPWSSLRIVNVLVWNSTTYVYIYILTKTRVRSEY